MVRDEKKARKHDRTERILFPDMQSTTEREIQLSTASLTRDREVMFKEDKGSDEEVNVRSVCWNHHNGTTLGHFAHAATAYQQMSSEFTRLTLIRDCSVATDVNQIPHVIIFKCLCLCVSAMLDKHQSYRRMPK